MHSFRSIIPFALLAAAACDSRVTDPATKSMSDAVEPQLSKGGGNGDPGAVFVLSNQVSGNAVLAFARDGDGSLSAPVSYPTGGTGTGGGLGNQGALSLGGDILYVVNPGSDNVSGFRVTASGLVSVGIWSSGGDLPISLARTGARLYVLNDGSATTVTGFSVGATGALTPIAGSTKVLPGVGPNAAQVGVSPDGVTLVVTLKGTNQLVSYSINANGTLGAEVVTASSGPTPFGFAFDKRGTLVVSEAAGGVAGASTVSSYRASVGGFGVISASVPNGQAAVCWVAISPNGRFAYVTNTGSATLTGYAMGHEGSISMLDPSGVTATSGTSPIDLSFSHNGRYVYVLNAGSRSISAYRADGGHGALTPIGETGGLPVGANGVAAR